MEDEETLWRDVTRKRGCWASETGDSNPECPGMNVRATQSCPVHGASPINRALLCSAGTAGVPA